MADEPNDTPNTQPAPEPKRDPVEAFNNLLKDKFSGDALALASKLFDENYTFRNTIRELTGKQPKEGAIVLSPEDAKKWKAYQELGVELKDIKAVLERVPELEKENKQLSNTETIFELSDIGLDGSKLKRNVLKEQLFDKFPDAVVRFDVEKDKDGKESKVAFIRTGDKELPFTEFARENLADYLPALKAEQPQEEVKRGNSYDPPPADRNAPTAQDNAAKAAQARSTHSHF